jgi:hypothetical protein
MSQTSPHYRQQLQHLFLCFAALPLLSSCTSPALHTHFRDYNTAYADALNEQMLLNLARLENGHPAYYLAIGAIDDRMTISSSATVGGSGSYQEQKTVPAGAISRVFTSLFGFNGSGTVSESRTPDFQFIPLNNAAVTEQVLQPLSPSVFYTLYQQGYPIDQLMRVMIERVETTLPGPNTNQELILVNSPTRGTPESYGKFLRACAILRELQRSGCLSLEANNKMEDLGPVSFDQSKAGGNGPAPGAPQNQPGQSGKKGKPGQDGTPADSENSGASSDLAGGSGSGGASSQKVTNPAIKDYSDADAKGWGFRDTTNGWLLTQKSETPVFTLKRNVMLDFVSTSQNPAFSAQLMSNPRRMAAIVDSLTESGLTDSQLALATNLIPIIVLSLANSDFAPTNADSPEVIADTARAVCVVLELLNEGISVQTKVSSEKQANTRLILRSFGRAMEAVASEQQAFDALVKANPSVGHDERFCSLVPNSEKNPVIRIDWTNRQGPRLPPLQTLHYAGRSYEVTDPVLDPLDPNAGWNRDVFRLMVALGSQVTVDISKFQQQVFQLRTD